MNESISVLIVDDHPMMRNGLRNSIEIEPSLTLIGEAENGEEAVQMARLLKPDVILMDLIMPIKDGIEATKEIVFENPNAHILVLTSSAEDKNILAAIEAGALGYVLKDIYPEMMFQAIRNVHNGNPFFSPTVAKQMMGEIRTGKHKKKNIVPLWNRLTEREVEVVKLVALGMTNKEIAERLTISEGTVRSHVSNILKKLNLENRSQVVLYAIQSGTVEMDESVLKNME